MKGRLRVQLLNKEEDRIGVYIKLFYREYKGYLFSGSRELESNKESIKIGRDRVNIEKLMREDKKLMKEVCLNPKDIIDMDYIYNKRRFNLHLEKVYELHYDGFREENN